MSQSERQSAILERVEAAGACSYQDLARLVGVSEMTIRRDVNKLAQGGALIKTEWREDKADSQAALDEEDRLKAGLPTGCDFVRSPAFRRKCLIFTPFAPVWARPRK